MSRIWACSVQVIRYEADDEGRSWARSVQVPTFYLLGDVQGIRTDEEAATIARSMFVDTGNPFENVYVNVAETSMGAHESAPSGLLETCEEIAALEHKIAEHKLAVEKTTGMTYDKFVGDMRKLVCG